MYNSSTSMAWAWPQTWVFHSENCHAGLKLCNKVQNRKPGFKPRVVYQNDNAAACREHISQQAAWARHFPCVAGILTQPSTSSRLQLSAMIAPTPVPPPSPATTTSQQNTSTMVPSTSCSPLPNFQPSVSHSLFSKARQLHSFMA